MNRQLKYNQAKYEIMNLIAAEHLQKGDRLPSIRKMDERFSFSEICLRRALDELAAQGYLEKRKGSGIYLARAIDNWTRSGELLYLEISPKAAYLPSGTIALREYLRERSIFLHAMTGIHPDNEIVNLLERVSGVIVSGWITEEWVRFLSALSIPVIYIGRHSCTGGLPTIDCDWEAAVRILLAEFQKNPAIRRIGLINGAKGYYPGELFCKAYLEEGKRLGFDVSAENIYWKPTWKSQGLRDFLASRPPFDALLVESGSLPHVMIAFRQHGGGDGTVLGTLDRLDDNLSDERVMFISYGGDVLVEAGKVFFESMNDPDYFKKGPYLMSARLVRKEADLPRETH